jgi:hypothetical protein
VARHRMCEQHGGRVVLQSVLHDFARMNAGTLRLAFSGCL